MTKEQAIAAPLTILAVDDDADVLRATERILQEAGFDVLTGATAAAAIELTYHHRPALVLLDVMLPDGNGVDVARQLKSDPALADVFVILYSGSRISSDDQAKGLAEGLADGYMVRPLSKPELLARIDAFLRIRETQRALRQSEQSYRLLADHSTDVVWLMDMDMKTTYQSPSSERLRGFTTAELHDLPLEKHLTPESLKAVLGVLHAEMPRIAADSGYNPVNTLELEYYRKDGSTVWSESKFSIIRDGSGRPASILGEGRDITERRQAEAALRQSEARFRRVSEATSDFAYSCVGPPGGSLTFDWLTGAVEPITGWSREEVLEWGCWKALVLEEDVPLFEERVIGLAPGESGACELRIRDKQGGIRWLAAYSVAEHDPEDPAVHRLYGACQDISERKRAEEGLLESLATQQSITQGVIAALVRTIEVRDPYTAGHQRRVSELAVAMALRMGLGEERAEGLRVAGLLHDVGMVNIPAEILARPGRLSTLELELIKGHPEAGYEILEAIHFPWLVAETALQHHERLDGSGYPARLGADDILPEARILAVADVVEAMASHRPYRAALGLEAALAEVRAGAGVRYDPDAVAACEQVFAQGFAFTAT